MNGPVYEFQSLEALVLHAYYTAKHLTTARALGYRAAMHVQVRPVLCCLIHIELRQNNQEQSQARQCPADPRIETRCNPCRGRCQARPTGRAMRYYTCSLRTKTSHGQTPLSSLRWLDWTPCHDVPCTQQSDRQACSQNPLRCCTAGPHNGHETCSPALAGAGPCQAGGETQEGDPEQAAQSLFRIRPCRCHPQVHATIL